MAENALMIGSLFEDDDDPFRESGWYDDDMREQHEYEGFQEGYDPDEDDVVDPVPWAEDDPRPDPPPGPAPPAIPGWPPPAAPVARAWIVRSDGSIRYMLQNGDTLSGLAQTYLGAYTRWKEIWAENPELSAQGRSADQLFVGETLKMPPDAIANARKRGFLRGAPMTRNTKIALAVGGVAAVAVVGGVTWYLWPS